MDIEKIINEFVEYMNTLNIYFDAHDNVVDVLINESKYSKEETPYIDALNHLSRLIATSQDDQNLFNEIVSELNENGELFSKDELKDIDEVIKKIAEVLSSEDVEFIYEDKKLKIRFNNHLINKRFQEHMSKVKAIYNQRNVFLQTSLIALTNAYEFFISKLMNYVIVSNFEKIESEVKTLSYAEIFKMGSMDEVKERIVENITDEYLRKSNQEWIKFFAKYSKKELVKDLEFESDYINEIYQRRNIVVHNGAIINRYYLNNVNDKFAVNLKIGEEIKVDKDYLKTSHEKVSEMFFKLVFAYWQHNGYVSEEVDKRFNVFQSIAYDKLRLEEYEMAEKIYKIIQVEYNKLNAQNKLLFNLNYCQSLKWQDKKSEYEKHLRKIDFSVCDNRHKLCKHLLDDDYVGASKVLNILLDDKSEEATQNRYNDINYYIDWPIFKTFKNTPEFDQLTQDRKYEIVNQ